MSNAELAERAALAIADAEEAGREHARLTGIEMGLEADRHAVKAEAIRRIMDTQDNVLTGKPHSASSAEAVVTTDAEYRRYLREMQDTVVAKNNAFTRAIAAQLRAKLAIALLAGEPALQEVA